MDTIGQLEAFEREHPLDREWNYSLGSPLRISREIARRLRAVDDPELQRLGKQLRLANQNIEVRLRKAKAYDAIPVN